MSRNSSGTYSLPAGNPVVTGTTISSAWANATMADIGAEITDSLDRSGKGPMLAGLPLADGTSSLPGLAWGTELTSGFYRAGSNDFRFVIATTELFKLTSNLVQLSGTAPIFRVNETDAAANNKLWEVIVNAETLAFRVLTDALASTNWLVVDRTAGVVDSIALTATAASFTGNFTFSAAASFGVGGSAVYLSSSGPAIIFDQSNASATNRRWAVYCTGEAFRIATISDTTGAGVDWLSVDRTGTVVDNIGLSSTALSYNGLATFSSSLGNLNAPIKFSAALPGWILDESGAAANNRFWRFYSTSEQLNFDIINDAASSSAPWLQVDRTGVVVDKINLLTPLLQAQGIHNGTAPTGTNNYIASGTYTPTATNGTNASAAAAQVTQWIRVGRVVIVSGQASCTSGGAGAIIISLSLPIASNLTSNFQLTGSGECNGAAIATDRACAILGDTTNDRADFTTLATAAGSLTYNYTYVYLVN